MGEFRDYYANHFRDHIQLFGYVSGTLSQLKTAGIKTGIVTTKQQEQAELVARQSGLAGWMDVVHGWREGRRHKPDPEPVATTLLKLGVTPGSALFVGDTEQDILAGRAAGTATCAVTYGYRPVALLRMYQPDFLVSSFAEIYGIATHTDLRR